MYTGPLSAAAEGGLPGLAGGRANNQVEDDLRCVHLKPSAGNFKLNPCLPSCSVCYTVSRLLHVHEPDRCAIVYLTYRRIGQHRTCIDASKVSRCHSALSARNGRVRHPHPPARFIHPGHDIQLESPHAAEPHPRSMDGRARDAVRCARGVFSWRMISG